MKQFKMKSQNKGEPQTEQSGKKITAESKKYRSWENRIKDSHFLLDTKVKIEENLCQSNS